jgi:hypothetical protein
MRDLRASEKAFPSVDVFVVCYTGEQVALRMGWEPHAAAAA